jgi:Fic family protein
MIVNGYRTMALIRERLDQPLDVALLHELQSTITFDTLDDPEHESGRLRSSDDVEIVDVRDGEAVFTPPPASQLDEQVGRLIAYANSEHRGEEFVHPLVKGSLLHFWLAYLHPYVDGNGRTARALFYWYMLKQGYFLFQFLTVSRVIHRSRMQYYRAFLNSEADDNDLTYFLIYKIGAVQKAIGDLHARLDALRDEQQRMLAIGSARELNARQRAILDHALRHPSQHYTFDSHKASHGISYQTSRTDLLELVDRRFPQDLGGRPRIFVPDSGLKRRVGL